MNDLGRMFQGHYRIVFRNAFNFDVSYIGINSEQLELKFIISIMNDLGHPFQGHWKAVKKLVRSE